MHWPTTKSSSNCPARPPRSLQGRARFAALLQQGHPLLRPVVLEYQGILDDLARGKTRHLDEALAEAENYRTIVVERIGAIEDYLNWFEATQIPSQSGDFDAYLKTAARLENAAAPPNEMTPSAATWTRWRRSSSKGGHSH